MSHDHGLSRCSSGEGTDLEHDNDGFANYPSGYSQNYPQNYPTNYSTNWLTNHPANHPTFHLSSPYVSYYGMEQHPYPKELDFSEADSVPVAVLQPNWTPQLPLQASGAQPQVDPCQAWEAVNDTLSTTDTPWDPLSFAPQPEPAAPSSIVTYSQYTQSPFDVSHLSPPPHPIAPSWTCDGVSTRSSSSCLEPCSLCDYVASSSRMRRHYKDRHPQIGDPKYRCKCNRTAKSDRKWEHKRHLEKFGSFGPHRGLREAAGRTAPSKRLLSRARRSIVSVVGRRCDREGSTIAPSQFV
ncbi:hypothetical protein LZ31DRAFT_184809 [Colletotrichum somersetense]|nr:hypothetical protein LZ31DRAFT_184809 [Colletotrichum somersetense]